MTVPHSTDEIFAFILSTKVIKRSTSKEGPRTHPCGTPFRNTQKYILRSTFLIEVKKGEDFSVTDFFTFTNYVSISSICQWTFSLLLLRRHVRTRRETIHHGVLAWVYVSLGRLWLATWRSVSRSASPASPAACAGAAAAWPPSPPRPRPPRPTPPPTALAGPDPAIETRTSFDSSPSHEALATSDLWNLISRDDRRVPDAERFDGIVDDIRIIRCLWF